MESSLIIIIINFLYYIYLLKGEVCAPLDKDNFTKRLDEIWHLLTLVRPGYIFYKMADDRGKNSCKNPCLSMRTHPLPPPPLRVVSPSRDEFTTSCKRSAEFCKEISEKLARLGELGGRVGSGTRDHMNGALLIESFSVLWNRILWECSMFTCLVYFVYFRGIHFGCNLLVCFMI